MKKNSKRRVMLFSIMTIALCVCLITGSTFAIFTDSEAVNIAVTAGNVEISASIKDGSLKTWSLGEDPNNPRTDGSFANGGSAEVGAQPGQLDINLMTPGDVVQFTIKIINSSNVDIVYRVKGVSALVDNSVPDLSNALVTSVKVNGVDGQMSSAAKNYNSGWIEVVARGTIAEVTVTVRFPNGTPDHDNPFRNGKASIAFTVEAVQGNGVDSNGNLITT